MSDEARRHYDELKDEAEALRLRATEEASRQSVEIRTHAEDAREYLQQKQEEAAAALKAKSQQLKDQSS